MAEVHDIQVILNGQAHTVRVESRTHLADMLRHQLGCTGTHIGCEHGVCGACTVLVDGASARSCLMFAVQAQGASIETVEGLASGDTLSEMQEALSRHGGLQCGYCTSGVLMTLKEFLAETAGRTPDEEEIRAALSGNLCRCTGYQGMVDAVLEVVNRRSKGNADVGA
jgi:aerobic-type carbon monoxide dehydrogenase small subunit (CoxS/CutS family)